MGMNAGGFNTGMTPMKAGSEFVTRLASVLRAMRIEAEDANEWAKKHFGVVVQTGPLAYDGVPDEKFTTLIIEPAVAAMAEQISKDLGENSAVCFYDMALPVGAVGGLTIRQDKISVRVVPFYNGADNKEHMRFDVLYS